MPVDFEIDNTYDLVIKDGDFAVSESNEADIDLILNSEKGNWKQWPLVGFGVKKYLEAAHSRASLDKMKRDIQLQLQADGFRVSEVKIMMANGEIQNISIDGERE